MYKATPRLILHPENTRHLIKDNHQLISSLLDIQFINETAGTDNTYTAGKEFINLLTFLGCSPDIKLSPNDGENYCTVSIPDAHETVTLLGYTSTVIPRCPSCKHKISDWKQHFHDWKQGDHVYSCTECQAQTPVANLKWRQEGGYGHSCVVVNHIHPHEAVPSEKLLNTLQQASATAWSYFYANN